VQYRVVFSPEADAQLRELYLHIAEAASPEIAARFTDAIVDYCVGFEDFPHRGTKRDELRASRLE
jgi:plasmid stabilization system protein ParE